MKLINEQQQNKIRLRYEVLVSAMASTVLVSLTAFFTSPLAYGLFQQTGV